MWPVEAARGLWAQTLLKDCDLPVVGQACPDDGLQDIKVEVCSGEVCERRAAMREVGSAWGRDLGARAGGARRGNRPGRSPNSHRGWGLHGLANDGAGN
jgi:hypothetical protein